MAKITLVIFGLIFIIQLIRCDNLDAVVSGLMDELDEKAEEMERIKKSYTNSTTDNNTDNNSTSIVEKLFKSGIEALKQSAQVQKLTGIKDSIYPAFINHFVTKLDVPLEFKDEMKDNFNTLVEDVSNDWKNYRFLYKKSNGGELLYVSILAQHDTEKNVNNWLYTQINTQFNMTDIFVVSTRVRRGNSTVDTVDVVSKPREANQKDIDFMMTFFDVVATKSFGTYLGIGRNSLTFLSNNYGKEIFALKNKLDFLQI